MPELQPIARSPIPVASPCVVRNGWQVSARRSRAKLRLIDWTPCAKVLVRHMPEQTANGYVLPPFGRAAAHGPESMIMATGIGAWMILGRPGSAASIIGALATEQPAAIARDATHAHALLRLAGESSADVLSRVCAINMRPEVFLHRHLARTSIARVAAALIRDDLNISRRLDGGEPHSGPMLLSYLVLCDRTAGQYMFDMLCDAGTEFGLEVDGFVYM